MGLAFLGLVSVEYNTGNIAFFFVVALWICGVIGCPFLQILGNLYKNHEVWNAEENNIKLVINEYIII